MLRVALLCEESAGARVLQHLAAAGHAVAALLTSPGSPAWALGAKLGLAPIHPRWVREPGFAAELAEARADLLLNVHSLLIVPGEVLRVPRLGAFNLHPGLLPRFAGLNAPSWAIYHGEERHGVTLHRMEPGIDTGAIVYQSSFPIRPEDTGLSLALRCVQEGLPLVARLLETAASDPRALPSKPQDRAQRRYFGAGAPQGGVLRWDELARRIRDFVRACDYRPFASPWGAPRARLAGREHEVLEVALTGEPSRAAPGTEKNEHGATLVAAADEWIRIVRARLAPPALAPLP
jgi:methionyl-tRNA formyltransferase